jgi:steroid delta-isomerase-like uncharacterized protein
MRRIDENITLEVLEMSTSPIQAISTTAEAEEFLREYFDTWRKSDVDEIMNYFADDVELVLPIGTLQGKDAVRSQFVAPFTAAFPGNVHEPQCVVYQNGVAAVEWRFKAEHLGELNGIPASGRKTDLPGCSFYFIEEKRITAGHVYFNMPTLLEQIGVNP